MDTNAIMIKISIVLWVIVLMHSNKNVLRLMPVNLMNIFKGLNADVNLP